MVRAELRLARPSSEPLAHLGLDPDPLQSFARVLAGLDPERGEQAEVAVDLLPCDRGGPPAAAAPAAQEARRYDGAPARVVGGLLEVLGGGVRAGRQPAEMVRAASRSARRSPRSCCRPSRCFSMQILMRCSPARRAGPLERLQGLLGCFDAFAGANSLRVVGVRLLGLAFLGSDLPGPARLV